jgi:hypothetical protein
MKIQIEKLIIEISPHAHLLYVRYALGNPTAIPEYDVPLSPSTSHVTKDHRRQKRRKRAFHAASKKHLKAPT